MKHPRPRKKYPLLIVCILLLGGFVADIQAAPPAGKLPGELPGGELTFERWYVVMMDSQRVGNMHATEHVEGEYIITRESMNLKLRRGSIVLRVSHSTQFTETADGKPVQATSMLQAAAQPMRSKFVFTDDGIDVVRTLGKRVRREKLALVAGDYLTPAAAQRYMQQETEAGAQTILLSVLDVSSGEPIAVAIAMQRVGAENIEVLGKIVPAEVWEIRSSNLGGVVARQYIDAKGQMIKTTLDIMGLKLEVLEADEAIANSKVDPPEVVASTLIKPTQTIGQPREIRQAVYKLTLPDNFKAQLPRGGYQRVTWADEHTVVVTVDLDEPVNPTGDEVDERYLASTTMLDHEHAAIAKLVADALGEEAATLNTLQKAERLRAAVYTFVKSKNLSVGFATATQVATTAEGDCTEHAVLLAAMLRAADIPSRTVTGLIYVDRFLGHDQVFGYHMWTQAWLNPPPEVLAGVAPPETSGSTTHATGTQISGGARWVDLDGTLDRPFDAAHIALATSAMGEAALVNDMVQLLPLFSALKIDILQTSP